MTKSTVTTSSRTSRIRRWIRYGFLLWAVTSTTWLANSVRTRGVDNALLRTGNGVSVLNGSAALEFRPASSRSGTGLIFFCGSGVAAEAYAPLLRPLADAGYPVFVIKLPYRFALLEAHKQDAMKRARDVIANEEQITHWVMAGHSLGGALAARLARAEPTLMSALVLIGTTHPKQEDLSSLHLSITKIYATNDGVARADQVLSNKRLLPQRTRWVQIDGGNHSQFGHYGHQLFDGSATISREEQQARTRAVLLESLTSVPG